MYSPIFKFISFYTNKKLYFDALNTLKKEITFGYTIMTLIYSLEVFTIQPNYKSQKSIKSSGHAPNGFIDLENSSI